MAHTGQVAADAAEVYERVIVPAVFAEWAPRVADAAGVRAGHRVLDVACGTGVAAREAARRVGPGGKVVGLDRNPAMLAVARRGGEAVEWREGVAERLPFGDAAFDAVLSQFGLMYFEDRVGALAEMRRVVRPEGRVAVAVWDALERQPVEREVVRVLAERFGEDAADELRAPFALGDTARLRGLFLDAGFSRVEVRTVEGTTRAPSPEAYVDGLLRGWTLAEKLREEDVRDLVSEAARIVAPVARREDGLTVMPAPAHVVAASP